MMNWWLPHNFEAKKPHLKRRMRLIRDVRGVFEEQGFWEVETPAMQVMPGADVHIHAFEVQGGEAYLHTSPELAMKKLLVAGAPKIYQICRVFRRDPDTPLHAREFTMLEWYRAGAGYEQIMEDCVELLRACAKEYRFGGKVADPFKEWQRLTVCAAFEVYAGIDLAAYLEDTQGFAKAAGEQGIRVTQEDRWDDIFHAVMAEKIEPHLGVGVPTILYEYPASMAALARRKPDDPRFAERFELYVCGVELANAFGELTDPAEQRARFEADMALKEQIYGETYPVDEDFLAALEHGMPACSGIALGIDRLAMLASGVNDIKQVLWCDG